MRSATVRPHRTSFQRTIRRGLAAAAVTGLAGLAAAAPALACAGLVTPGGNVKLLRTATLSAWADGFEHYVTSFVFEGGGAEVGSIVPLPGIPSKVERGGDWTLQRLERETQPQPARSAAPTAASGAESDQAEEVYNARIDALDITILKGGGPAVAEWAREHGFSLTPDAPEILDFYAARSKIFMAARFNTEAAKERSQAEGEGTPIHLTIPMDEPWVPLRILGLGRQADETIDADVYLLTPKQPALLPKPGEGFGDGLVPEYSQAASKSLLDDLRSDKGMEWVPTEMWLTYLRVAEQAPNLRYDLAVAASDTKGSPSPVMAGLEAPPAPQPTTTTTVAPSTTTVPPTTRPKPTTTTAPPAPVTTVPPTTQPPVDLPVPPADPQPEATVKVALPARSGGGGGGGLTPLTAAGAIAGGGLGAGLVAYGWKTRWLRGRA